MGAPHRTPVPPTRPPGAAARISLPEHPSGPALASCVRSIRLALARGDVAVDTTPARAWPPGPRLVLEGLQEAAHRRGRRWHDLPAARV